MYYALQASPGQAATTRGWLGHPVRHTLSHERGLGRGMEKGGGIGLAI